MPHHSPHLWAVSLLVLLAAGCVRGGEDAAGPADAGVAPDGPVPDVDLEESPSGAAASIAERVCQVRRDCGHYPVELDLASDTFTYRREAVTAACESDLEAEILEDLDCFDLPPSRLQLIEECINSLAEAGCAPDEPEVDRYVSALNSGQFRHPIAGVSSACDALMASYQDIASCRWGSGFVVNGLVIECPACAVLVGEL